ncbi:hypothetical protein HY17_02990 [Hyphomonas sp. CY54-11-8]|nr:hypothetical protein HY17_02990 [Hyphomonas sp. CY54-11-8]RAN39252.1 hypothetical protein HY26_16580 [Hyphomonas sp. GM-8P]
MYSFCNGFSVHGPTPEKHWKNLGLDAGCRF